MSIYMGSRNGFAFSISMWIIASLLFATVVILRFAKEEMLLSQELSHKLETQITAQNILETLKFYIPTSDTTSTSLKNNLFQDTVYSLPVEIFVDGREYNLSREISISLKDTSSMINILYGGSKLIAKTLTTEENEDITYILRDALADWRDRDNAVRSNGAEQNNYSISNKNITVRDRADIQDIYELRLINGFNKINFKKVEKNIYYGRSIKINLMLIENKRYLATLLNIDESLSQKMLELRLEDPMKFKIAIQKLEFYNDDHMGFTLEKQFFISIVVRKGRAISRLNTIISFDSFNKRPYITIMYKLQ